MPTFLRVASLAAASVALAATSCTLAVEPDPVELLKTSAETIATAPSATGELSTEVRIVMGEETMESGTAFDYSRGGDAFSLVPAPGSDAFELRAAGSVYTVLLPQAGKYTINQSAAPLAEFVQTPVAAGLANGLGGLALALVDPIATADLVEKVTAAEYLGEVETDDGPRQVCRFTIEEDLTIDAYFTTGDQPVITRLSPDLTAMAATSPLAQQHDNFAYTIDFRYTGWNLDADLDRAAFVLAEPEGAELVESFMRRRQSGPHPMVGAEAPRFVLATPEGEQVDLNDHLGKDVVLLDFWATWCPPCVAALPKIDRVAESFAEQGVAFYAVNQDETAQEVLDFLEARELTAPVVLDEGSVAARSYGVRGLPTSVLIGKDGRVQVVHVGLGADLEQQLSAELESLVGGEDLAAVAIAEREAEEARRQARLDALRALLGAG